MLPGVCLRLRRLENDGNSVERGQNSIRPEKTYNEFPHQIKACSNKRFVRKWKETAQ